MIRDPQIHIPYIQQWAGVMAIDPWPTSSIGCVTLLISACKSDLHFLDMLITLEGNIWQVLIELNNHPERWCSGFNLDVETISRKTYLRTSLRMFSTPLPTFVRTVERCKPHHPSNAHIVRLMNTAISPTRGQIRISIIPPIPGVILGTMSMVASNSCFC